MVVGDFRGDDELLLLLLIEVAEFRWEGIDEDRGSGEANDVDELQGCSDGVIVGEESCFRRIGLDLMISPLEVSRGELSSSKSRFDFGSSWASSPSKDSSLCNLVSMASM